MLWRGLVSGGSSMKPISRYSKLQVHIYLPKEDPAGKRAAKIKTEYSLILEIFFFLRLFPFKGNTINKNPITAY